MPGPGPAAGTVPISSEAAPELARIPLSLDVALHASPVISLIIDFYVFEKRYPRNEAVYEGAALCACAGVAYGSWVEWLATYNGSCE